MREWLRGRPTWRRRSLARGARAFLPAAAVVGAALLWIHPFDQACGSYACGIGINLVATGIGGVAIYAGWVWRARWLVLRDYRAKAREQPHVLLGVPAAPDEPVSYGEDFYASIEGELNARGQQRLQVVS